MKTWAYLAVFMLVPASAWADDDDNDGRFAAPPQGRAVPAAVAYDEDGGPVIATEPERPRSAARVEVGPVGITTGKGMGIGAGGALDIGRGSVGGRISAAWARGEPGGGSLASESFAQYAGE